MKEDGPPDNIVNRDWLSNNIIERRKLMKLAAWGVIGTGFFGSSVAQSGLDWSVSVSPQSLSLDRNESATIEITISNNEDEESYPRVPVGAPEENKQDAWAYEISNIDYEGDWVWTSEPKYGYWDGSEYETTSDLYPIAPNSSSTTEFTITPLGDAEGTRQLIDIRVGGILLTDGENGGSADFIEEDSATVEIAVEPADLRSISYGQTKSGEVDEDDPEEELFSEGGVHYEPVAFDGEEGDIITADITVDDPYLLLRDPDGRLIYETPENPDYVLSGEYELQQTGEYEVIVVRNILRTGREDEFFSYELSLNNQGSDNGEPELTLDLIGGSTRPDSTVTIEFRLMNVGDAEATGLQGFISPPSNEWTVTGNPGSFNSLGAGETDTATITHEVPADTEGTYEFGAVVEDDDGNEASDTATVTVESGADLELAVSGGTSHPGGTVTVTYRLSNVGDTTVAGDSTLVSPASGEQPPGVTVNEGSVEDGGAIDGKVWYDWAIDPGEELSAELELELPGDIEVGEYGFTVEVEEDASSNRVLDTDSGTVIVEERPEFGITAQGTTDPVLPGETATITLTVSNTGESVGDPSAYFQTATESTTHDADYYGSAFEVASHNDDGGDWQYEGWVWSDVAPGEGRNPTVTLSVSESVMPGEYTFRIDVLNESGNTDDTATATITVGEESDDPGGPGGSDGGGDDGSGGDDGPGGDNSGSGGGDSGDDGSSSDGSESGGSDSSGGGGDGSSGSTGSADSAGGGESNGDSESDDSTSGDDTGAGREQAADGVVATFQQSVEDPGLLELLFGAGVVGGGYLAYRSRSNDESENQPSTPCPECGRSVSKSASFCEACGTDLTATTPEQPHSAQTAPAVAAYEDLTVGEQIESGPGHQINTATVQGTEQQVWLVTPNTDGGKTLTTRQTDEFFDRIEPWTKVDEHPNLLPVYGYGNEPLPWLAVKPAEYPSLADTVADLTIGQIVDLLTQTCEAVHHVRRYGLSYESLSCESGLMVSEEHVLYRGILDQLPREGAPTYELPSDTEDRTAESAAVYRIGALAYDLLTAQPPAGAASSIARPSVLNEDVSADLDSVVLKALAEDANDRHETVLHLRDDLRPVTRR